MFSQLSRHSGWLFKKNSIIRTLPIVVGSGASLASRRAARSQCCRHHIRAKTTPSSPQHQPVTDDRNVMTSYCLNAVECEITCFAQRYKTAFHAL